MAPGRRHRRQQKRKAFATKTIQPAALLTGPRQLLGLALNREIEQQGAQLLDLGPAHHHAIKPIAAAQALLREAPLTRKQQFALLNLQLLLLQPGLQRGRKAEAGLDRAALSAAPQQPGAGAALGPTQKGIEGIKQDRFTCSRLTGQHRESLAEAELQPLDQGDVAEAQSREHVGLR